MNLEAFGKTSVATLGDRYQRGKSVIYKRLKALDIKTEIIANRAYLNTTQLTLMDELHQFTQDGGTTAAFLFLKKRDSEG